MFSRMGWISRSREGVSGLVSIAAVTAPQPLCPITINSGVLRTLTLYSTEAMASVKAVLPALRITNSSPGVVSNTQLGDTRESEQVSTVAQGCWLVANALGELKQRGSAPAVRGVVPSSCLPWRQASANRRFPAIRASSGSFGLQNPSSAASTGRAWIRAAKARPPVRWRK